MSESPCVADVAEGTEVRRVSELRVVDLKAELKKRNLDCSGNKSALTERLRKALEEEGENPDEIHVTADTPGRKAPRRSGKGRKADDDGVEDAGMEEDSVDGQEDGEAGLLHEIDMMEMSVLDEADIDNGITAECADEYGADQILDSLSDTEENADLEMKEPQEVSTENSEEVDESPMESENEKVADILGETCKSEPLKEDASEQEKPLAQDASTEDPLKNTEEDDLSASARAENTLGLDLDSESAQSIKKETQLDLDSKENQELNKSEKKTDTEPASLGNASDQTSGLQATASEEQTIEMSEKGPKAETTDGKEEPEKTEEEDKNEESSGPSQSSTVQGADQKTSSDKDDKTVAKEEKGRSVSSSGRNLWVSGLSATTRATDLKNLFSKYGKVVGAKVVTNARSPGARCYGFVTMSSTEEATKCISHLHRTELHGRMISVERAKNEPAGKKPAEKNNNDPKKELKFGIADKLQAAESKSEKSISSTKKDEKAEKKDEIKMAEKKDEKTNDKKDGEDSKQGTTDRSRSTKSGSRGLERTVVMDKSKGEPVISVKTTSGGKEDRSSKSQERKSESKEKREILSFDKIKEQRERERQRQRDREIREMQRRRERERRERERIRMMREREMRDRLQQERERLEFERQRLERERMERERLERERMRIEQERRREQERIQREREELRRQQEQLRFEQERRPAVRRPYDMDGRRDDSYWPEQKRVAMDDRYGHGSDFSRQDRFHDLDHRDRSRFQSDSLDRRDSSRSMMGERDGQHYSDRRDGWSNFGSEKRMGDGRGGMPLTSREGRDWTGDHGRKIDGHQDRSWQGGDRGMTSGQGHMMNRGGAMAGHGGFMAGGNTQGLSGQMNRQSQMMQGGGMQGGFGGQDRGNRNDPRFQRRY
ncbi:scaffold attachment factor B1 [Latimeria chalumnae]|uniref:Scaffold attachment factor B n=1 Tax=Latimeria chalumnae TaxID=7897 RepID=H3BFB2_LATCH|nr:PREDICTED: scaffold attachment factor B2 isoform X1 [Latimeria chalumnae]|eukprot:XP_005989954.1 PREDICTED: scaffold attachment factor B2 isoform X1 [Latimeria chalumnae]